MSLSCSISPTAAGWLDVPAALPTATTEDGVGFDSPDAYGVIGEHRNVDYSPLRAILDWRLQGKRTCLVTIVNVEGSGPRTVGAQLAVSDACDVAGYLTGGCLERELAQVALGCIEDGVRRLERYGRGSRFIDMRLPCGSGIDVLFDPLVPDQALATAEHYLDARVPFEVRTDAAGYTSVTAWRHGADSATQLPIAEGSFARLYLPPVRVNVFGEGFAPLQLAQLLGTLGIECRLHSDERLTQLAADAMDIRVAPMPTAPATDDPWTAAAVLFHAHERELDLLKRLLRGPSFYVGAIGGRQVTARRVEQLKLAGLKDSDIARLTAPAGSIRRARTATELALGLSAEILATAREKRRVI